MTGEVCGAEPTRWHRILPINRTQWLVSKSRVSNAANDACPALT